MRHWLVLLCWALVTLTPGRSYAQQTDAAAAEVLFQKGRTAMTDEDFETACQMFQESLALDPAVGTVMNLAVCEERRGHLTASWERWQQALRLLDKGDDRIEFASSQVDAVALRLAHLTIRLAQGSPKDITIRRDGVALGQASLRQQLPVDPGVHIVTVESKRFEARNYTISLESGEHEELVVALGPAKAVDSDQEHQRGAQARKIGSIAAFGVGVLGLGAAVVTSVLLPGQDRKVEENCPNKACDSEGSDAVSGAKTLLAINTAGFIVAGVGLATGAVLLLTLPRKQTSSTHDKKSPAGQADEGKSAQARPRALAVSLVGSGINVSGEF